eukprot:s2227_g9.t1
MAMMETKFPATHGLAAHPLARGEQAVRHHSTTPDSHWTTSAFRVAMALDAGVPNRSFHPAASREREEFWTRLGRREVVAVPKWNRRAPGWMFPAGMGLGACWARRQLDRRGFDRLKRRAVVQELSGVINWTGSSRLTKEDDPEIYLIRGLFEASQLEELVALCEQRQGFAPSVQRQASGDVIVDQHRTSSSCPMLWPLMTPKDRLEQLRSMGGNEAKLASQIEKELQAVEAVQRRCAEVIGVDENRIEPLQLVKYLPGQYYSPHMDTHEEPERKSSYSGEQRSHTMLVFLSDVAEEDGGGHLHFPRLGVSVLPCVGDAVLWRNLTDDGEPDLRVLHEGVAPKQCQKLAMNVWVADRPFSLSAISAWQQKQAQPEPSSRDDATCQVPGAQGWERAGVSLAASEGLGAGAATVAAALAIRSKVRRRAHAGHPKSGRHGVAAAASGTVSTPIGVQGTHQKEQPEAGAAGCVHMKT